MQRVVKVLKHEAGLVIPPTVFFLFSFNLLVATVTLAVNRPVSWHEFAAASLAALVVGKAVLLADKLPFVNRYPEKPLIWNVAWKAGLYFVISLLLRVLERMVGAARAPEGFQAGLAEDLAHFEWTLFITVQLWLALLLFLYTGLRELVRSLGAPQVRRIFLHPPQSDAPAPSEPPAPSRPGQS